MPPIAPTRATALASRLQVFAGWQVAASCPFCRVLRVVKVNDLIAARGGGGR